MSSPTLRDILLSTVTNPYNTKGFRDITLKVREYSQNTCALLAMHMRDLLEDRNVSPVVKLRTMEVGDI
jgi:hypothetical protein